MPVLGWVVSGHICIDQSSDAPQQIYVVVGLYRRKDLLRRLWAGITDARTATPDSIRLIVHLVCMDRDAQELDAQVKLARELVDDAKANAW